MSKPTLKLACATLALGLATSLHAQTTNTINAPVFCKARILPSGGQTGHTLLSVTLPPTPGYTDPYGNPVTVWNLGDVTAGGVADTWHDGGPGFFTVRNTGNVAAYVYVVTSKDLFMYDNSIGNDYHDTLVHLFPSAMMGSRPRPTIGMWPGASYHDFENTYHLALTTDINARTPVWRSLDRAAHQVYYSNQGNYQYEIPAPPDFGPGNFASCSAYLGWLPPGEYQPFDMKYWAPTGFSEETLSFVFRVEACAFRRWDHDL